VLHARNKSHEEARISKKLSDAAVAALTLAEVTTVLEFDGFAAVMAAHPDCLKQVFGGPVDGAGLKGCEEYDEIARQHTLRNFAPQRALVKRAAELREEKKSDAEILQVLQQTMGATEAQAKAAIDSLNGLEANRALVKRAAELRAQKKSDAEILQVLQQSMGATPEHAQAAIDVVAQRALVKRAAELREEKKSDAEILGELQQSMGASKEHAKAAIDSLNGLEANRALVKRAAELRESGVQDLEEIYATLMQTGATKAQAEGAIACLDGRAANCALVSAVAKLQRFDCLDPEIIAELVAKGYDKAAVEGALRGLHGLADGRIAQGHAGAASKSVPLVRLADKTTRNWVDMKVEQNNDKTQGLSHDLVINLPKLATLYGPDQQACQLVMDDVKKQQTRVQDGKSMQSDKERRKRVKGDLDTKSGIWGAREAAKLRATLDKNNLCIVSQWVEDDRANLGPMSGPDLVSSIGAVRFPRPTWEARSFASHRCLQAS
jgi:hypothetical protein